MSTDKPVRSEQPSDICACGEYRSQHDPLTGRCKVCANSRAPYDGCVSFRFSRAASPKDQEHWDKYQRPIVERKLPKLKASHMGNVIIDEAAPTPAGEPRCSACDKPMAKQGPIFICEDCGTYRAVQGNEQEIADLRQQVSTLTAERDTLKTALDGYWVPTAKNEERLKIHWIERFEAAESQLSALQSQLERVRELANHASKTFCDSCGNLEGEDHETYCEIGQILAALRDPG